MLFNLIFCPNLTFPSFKKVHIGCKIQFWKHWDQSQRYSLNGFRAMAVWIESLVLFMHLLWIFKPLWCYSTLFQAQIWLFQVLKRPIWAVKFNFGNIGTNLNALAQTVFELWLFEWEALCFFHTFFSRFW